jgi:hypothetical protein
MIFSGKIDRFRVGLSSVELLVHIILEQGSFVLPNRWVRYHSLLFITLGTWACFSFFTTNMYKGVMTSDEAVLTQVISRYNTFSDISKFTVITPEKHATNPNSLPWDDDEVYDFAHTSFFGEFGEFFGEL